MNNKWEGIDSAWLHYDHYRIDKSLWESIKIKGSLWQPSMNTKQIEGWLNDNKIPCLIDKSMFPDTVFWFPNKENAIAFKIIWV